MSFYIRKSVKVGPFRLNLSKSGIGLSAGIKGLRIGTGPRGNYIHAGRHGVYYRKMLNGGRRSAGRPASPTAPPNQQTQQSSPSDMEAIDSGSVMEMRDESAAVLLKELNDCHRQPRLWPIVAVVTILIAIFVGGNGSKALSIYLTLGLGAALSIGAAYVDWKRKHVALLYDLEPDLERVFKNLHDAFDEVRSCGGKWHVDARGDVDDRKYQAGASEVIRRNSIAIAEKTPPYIKTNISIPSIPVGTQTLYLFPDRVLVYDKSGVGAVPYSELRVDVSDSKFIEDGNVPRDAEVIGRTWRYVNKSGGPDKRFKDNKELPIMLYQYIRLTSTSGLNELLQLSKRGAAVKFQSALSSLE